VADSEECIEVWIPSVGLSCPSATPPPVAATYTLSDRIKIAANVNRQRIRTTLPYLWDKSTGKSTKWAFLFEQSVSYSPSFGLGSGMSIVVVYVLRVWLIPWEIVYYALLQKYSLKKGPEFYFEFSLFQLAYCIPLILEWYSMYGLHQYFQSYLLSRNWNFADHRCIWLYDGSCVESGSPR
jgi:hypothetical protein